MGFFRWMFGLPLAAAITVGLFLMMSELIKKEAPTGSENEAPVISITAKLKPTRTDYPDGIFPPAPAQPTIETPRPGRPGGGGDGPGVTPGPIDPMAIKLPPTGSSVIQVAPPYPDACRSKGVEGVVIVQFDVTDRGETTNVQVISSPDRCFDRDVIRAVRGWRFPAEARRGVTEAIRFQFEE